MQIIHFPKIVAPSIFLYWVSIPDSIKYMKIRVKYFNELHLAICKKEI